IPKDYRVLDAYTNAQNEQNEQNLRPSDTIIEAIFDLMSISLIIFSIDAVHASNSRTVAKLDSIFLRLINYFIQSLIFAFSIAFTIMIYINTRDIFYLQYIIVSSCFMAINFILDVCAGHEPDILSSSEFIVHLIFFIIAVVRGYITNNRYLFILLPSLFVIIFPIIAYFTALIK
ncbi:10778_t:CDS:2, partial [Scutellospora calospora]